MPGYHERSKLCFVVALGIGGPCQMSAMHGLFLSVPTMTDESLQSGHGGVHLGVFQAGLIVSEITLLTGSCSGNIATWPNSRSLLC